MHANYIIILMIKYTFRLGLVTGSATQNDERPTVVFSISWDTLYIRPLWMTTSSQFCKGSSPFLSLLNTQTQRDRQFRLISIIH